LVYFKIFIYMKEYVCYFDGCCEPINPGGTMGLGIYIIEGFNEYKDSEVIQAKEENTNNVAEYLALIKLLKILKNKNGCKIEIYGDSKLVVMQMLGKWKIKKGSYKEQAIISKDLYNNLKLNNDLDIIWIPREDNTIADELSKKHLN
jgi:ribonuclease H / adenosylcobalamin/alpha-ribazole phosphatase